MFKAITNAFSKINSFACGYTQENTKELASLQMIRSVRKNIDNLMSGNQLAVVLEYNKFQPVMNEVYTLVMSHRLVTTQVTRGKHVIVIIFKKHESNLVDAAINTMNDDFSTPVEFVNAVGSLVGMSVHYEESLEYMKSSKCRCVLCTDHYQAKKYDWVID